MTASLESFQTRQALQEAFFGIEADLRWYVRRQPEGSTGGAALRELCSVWVRLLAPFIPFTCETLWQALGNEGLVSFAPWPQVDPALDRPAIELGEELLSRTVEDAESILKLLPITPSAVEIAVAPALEVGDLPDDRRRRRPERGRPTRDAERGYAEGAEKRRPTRRNSVRR